MSEKNRVPYPDEHLTFGARVGNAGRIVIPDWVREALNIKEGDYVLVTIGVQKTKAQIGGRRVLEGEASRESRVVYREGM
jgi:AbrB family looped-hinge helix DNA binding protein